MLSFKLNSTVRLDDDGKPAFVGCSIVKSDGSPITAPEFCQIIQAMPKMTGCTKTQVSNPGAWKWSVDGKTCSLLVEQPVEEAAATLEQVTAKE